MRTQGKQAMTVRPLRPGEEECFVCRNDMPAIVRLVGCPCNGRSAVCLVSRLDVLSLCVVCPPLQSPRPGKHTKQHLRCAFISCGTRSHVQACVENMRASNIFRVSGAMCVCEQVEAKTCWHAVTHAF